MGVENDLLELYKTFAKAKYSIGTQEALQEEEIYLKGVNVYANIEPFVKEALKFAKTSTSYAVSASIEEEASVVVLYSKNESLIDELLEFVSSDESSILFEAVLGRVDETTQKQLIEKLIKLNTPKSIEYALNSILSNGYEEYVDIFLNEEIIAKLKNKQTGYAFLAKMGGKKGKDILTKIFNDEKHPVIKEKIALELVHAKSKEAREYIKELYSIESYEALPYLLFAEDYQFVEDTFLEKYEEFDEEFTEAFYKMFSVAYGNPRMVPFYLKMLEDVDVAMQFSDILLRTFSNDSMVKPLETRLVKWEDDLLKINSEAKSQEEYDELFSKESAKMHKFVADFWKSKESYMLGKLDMNKRYYVDKPYDMAKIWQKEMVDMFLGRRALISYNGLMLLTGEYFPFDVNGLRSRQSKQSEKIFEYLEKNKDKYKAGSWTVWGMDYETFMKYE